MTASIKIRIAGIQSHLSIPPSGSFDLRTCYAFEAYAKMSPPASEKLIDHKKAIQSFLGFTTKEVDAIFGVNTLTRMESYLGIVLPPLPEAASMIVSKKSVELIIEEEVSSRDAYNKKYKHPVWPGGKSGVTIGIGYDLGAVGIKQFSKDWKNILPADTFTALASLVGLSGKPAKSFLTKTIRALQIPLEDALQVFYTVSLPHYAKQVCLIYPGVEKLPPDAQGVLLSLVYNRGASIKGVRRREMKNIIQWVKQMNLNKIAAEIRSMKRLWLRSKLSGLLKRRDAEADLVVNADYSVAPDEYVIL